MGERGREIPAYSIFGRISSPINCILIVRIKANFSVVRGLINFAPEDNGCQEMCRLTKFLEKARHLLAVQPILPKSLRRTLFFRGNFLLHPPKHEENLFMLSFTLDWHRNMNDKSKHRRDNLHKLADRRDWSFLATHMDVNMNNESNYSAARVLCISPHFLHYSKAFCTKDHCCGQGAGQKWTPLCIN